MKVLLSLFQLYSVIGQYSFRSGHQTRILSSYYKSFIVNPNENQCTMMPKHFSNWQFSPSTFQQLPIDAIKENYVRRNVKNSVFSEVMPSPLLTDIKLVDYSEDVLTNILDLNVSVTGDRDFLEFVAGNKVLRGSTPMAHRYGGYQFGSWAAQLGDGRAILLGEYVNANRQSYELQLKGAGKTPYSRDGDGRAVLRSSIREFLASEAMHYLGVPTSRAAALIVSDDDVVRDPLYDGYARKERAAVVLRVAPTWFRFGSLEILAKSGEHALLKTLTDFIIQHHFPEINAREPDKYVLFFSTVAEATMNTALAWQSLGFAHGVLNTDNMGITGLTIDYGPFGFCEAYDPYTSPNHSDREGRYCFNNQLDVVRWNLGKLADSLSHLLTSDQRKNVAEIVRNLEAYSRDKLRVIIRSKLGLEKDHECDNDLLRTFFDVMEDNGGDFTATFCQLGDIDPGDLMKEEVLELPRYWSLLRLFSHDKYTDLVELYRRRVSLEDMTESERRRRMAALNPRYVLRNWMAQSAIAKAESNDFSEVRFIQRVLRTPYLVNEEAERAGYSGPTPDWALGLKVSCSS